MCLFLKRNSAVTSLNNTHDAIKHVVHDGAVQAVRVSHDREVTPMVLF